MRLKLTENGIKGLKAKAQSVDYWDTLLPGFAVRVGTTGAKSFFVGRRVKGKYTRVTLKPQYPALSLADGREKGRQIIADAQTGISPEVRKKRTERGTFGAVTDAFMADYAKNLKTRGEYERKIRVDLADWRDRPIAEITRGDIKELIRLKARGLERGVAANRLLALISKIFNWAVGEEIIHASPAVRLKRPAEEKERERVATHDEIKRLWAAYDDLGYPHGAMFKIMLATGQRRGEIAGMKWTEIGADGWRLPSERAKRGRGHLVPLSTLAREVLAGIPEIGEHVFRARNDAPLQKSSKVYKRLYKLARIEDWEPEDSRRTAATHMRSLGVDRLTVAKILNHAEAGVTKVYDRYAADPEKTAGLERWAGKLREIVGLTPPKSNVRQFEKRRAV
jgi:integrase